MEDLDYSNEIWLPVVRWEGFYEISNFGRIKRLARHVHVFRLEKNELRLLPEKISFGANSYGYLRYGLFGNIRKDEYIHRMVAEAFLPNPENKPFIDHINTIRNDNRVENLRWVTAKENTRNEITYKRIFAARVNPIAITNKKVAKIDIDTMEILETFIKVRLAAKSIKASPSTISYACKFYPIKRLGYYWKFI